MKKWIACFLFISISQISFTQFKAPYFIDSERAKKVALFKPIIQNIYKDFAQKNHIPAIAYAIMVDDSLVIENYEGFINLSTQKNNSSNAVFRIASMSKSFTAMAIVKLRDEGKLNLDDAISKYIPAFKTTKLLTLDAAPITIRDLLTHGAGFPEDNPWGDRQLAKTDKDLQILLQELSFSTTTNSSYEYSNLGFALLGKIITIVSKQPYQTYIQENIFKPLGMKNTYYEYSKANSENLALGYRWINENHEAQPLLPDAKDGSWGAMGAMLTTIPDFCKYMKLYLNSYPSNSNFSSPIKKSSVREMYHPWRLRAFNANAKNSLGISCPTVAAYGYGLVNSRDCNNAIWVGHSGGLPGFGSHWRFLPEYGIGMVVFANRTYAPMAALTNLVMDSLLKIAQLQPRVLPISEVLLQRQNSLLQHIQTSFITAAKDSIFAENFWDDYPIKNLQQQTKETLTQVGSIKMIKPFVAENNLRGSFIIVGSNRNAEVYFTLTPEKFPKIQEFHFNIQ